MSSCLLDYDKAVYDKIHALFDEVIFAAPEEAFTVNAKRHKGKVFMPFVSVYRLPDFSINTQMYNDPMVRKGWYRTSNNGNQEFPNQRVAMHGVPVTLQYQLDVYATTRNICDGLAAELLLELKENPWVNVKLTDMGEDYIQQFNFEVEESVSDNTSITEFDESNRYYRLTITADLPEAVIYRIDKAKTIKAIAVDFDLINIDGD